MIDMDMEILKFIYIISIREATLQKAYTGDKKWFARAPHPCDVIKIMKPFIDGILKMKYKSQDAYDKTFYEIAERICNYYNNCPECKGVKFTFGNAQKFINIFIKYLYIKSYDCKNTKDCFKYCHCPMDRIMLKKVWNSKGTNDLKNYKKNDFTRSWSGEDFQNVERYKDFQKMVQKLAQNIKVSPLEYDYINWRDVEESADGC